MHIPAIARSARARRFSARGAVVVGSLALAGTAALGTAQAASAAPAVARPAAQTAGTTTYTVQPGDTLAAIARSQNVTGGWQAIASVNTLINPHRIVPGQVLNLP